MKIISIALMAVLAVMAVLFSSAAQAYTCRTSDNGVIGPGGSPVPVDVRVRIGPLLNRGKNEIINVSQVSCKNDVYSWTDFLLTSSNTLDLNSTFFSGLRTGLTINGTDYDTPVPAGVMIQTLTRLNAAPVPIRMFIYVNSYPSSDISIKQGDVIGTINFSQRNDRPDCDVKCGPYKWRLIADNDAYFMTTSCTINNGQQIDVDFGTIRQDHLTETVASATIKQDKSLNYQCDDTTATQDIAVRLVSSAAGFSSDLIATSNTDVGVAMVYNGSVIKPNETFRSRITNGVGSDTVTFVPVKSSTNFKNIATGPLTGSATLIFSAP